MKPIHVIVADDHELFRAGLRAILRGVEGIEVIGEAGDGREALEMIAKAPPDVLLLDINMPGMGGLEAAGLVAEQFPEVKVMILSMHASEQYVGQALALGRPVTCSRTRRRSSWKRQFVPWHAGKTISAPPSVNKWSPRINSRPSRRRLPSSS